MNKGRELKRLRSRNYLSLGGVIGVTGSSHVVRSG